jgi:hypothetical protein
MRDIIYEVIKRQDDIFSIIDLRTDTLIGRCLLFDIDPLNRRAMLGMFSFKERAFVCYRLVDFKESEIRRQARIIGGKKHNLVMIDMRADERPDDKVECADST